MYAGEFIWIYLFMLKINNEEVSMRILGVQIV